MPEPAEDDLVQLKRIHGGGRRTAVAYDVARWRAAGWLEPEPSWKLTPAGLALICGQPEFGLPDPGPDLRRPPAVRPRTPEEVEPARRALRRLSDTLLRRGDLILRARGRLAWLLSVLPLSTPEEVGDALDFACQTASLDLEGDSDRAALFALADISRLVDDMRAEVDGARIDVDPPPPDPLLLAARAMAAAWHGGSIDDHWRALDQLDRALAAHPK